jgi:FkbM family methyltransferase
MLQITSAHIIALHIQNKTIIFKPKRNPQCKTGGRPSFTTIKKTTETMGLQRVVNMVANIENWSEYLQYKYGGKKNSEFLFKLKNGQTVLVPRIILPEFKESFYDQVYFKNLPQKLLALQSPVIIDIGANVGYFSLCAILKLRQPRIFSYEPIKKNFALLGDNLTRAPYPGLSAFNMAVSDKAGNIILRFSEDNITTSASLLSNATGLHEETVTCTSLPDIMRDNKLSGIQLLKMDCEGAEYNILYTTPKELFDKINCIALETHIGSGPKENHGALADYLKGLGYNIVIRKADFIWAYRDPANWV